MPAAVVLVCAYAGGAVAGGAVLAAGATMVTAVVAGALVGAAIGAVGAAVTGGDIKKSAIMGALAGAGGAYLSGPAVASSGYVGGTTAKVATGAETMAGTEVAASSVAPTGAEAMTGTTTTTTIPGAVTPPPPPPPPPPISETTKVLAGLAAGQTLGGYLQGKGTAEAKSEELQAQQDQRGQMFAGMEMPSVSAAVADKPRNLKREFDLYLNESSKFLAAMQKQVTPGTTAPAEVI